MAEKSAKATGSPSSAARRPQLQKRESIAQFATNFSADQLKELKAMFAMLDKDKDGHLSGNELLAMFGELGVKTSFDEITRLTKELDKDGDGKISFKEFVEGITWMKKSSVWKPAEAGKAATAAKSDSVHRRGGHQRSASVMNFIKSLDQSKIQRVKELFDLADTDQDGVITKAEFFQLCKSLKIEVSKQEFEVLFANLDTSNNGRIEFGEFLSGMRWLEKGANMAKTEQLPPAATSEEVEEDEEEDDSELVIKDLREQNKVLRNILKEILQKGLSTARTSLKASNVDLAKTILEVLDVDFIIDVQDVVGAVLNEKEQALYKKMKDFIAENS